MEQITRTFKVYGQDGHRQRESFCPSTRVVTLSDGSTVELRNSDKTGTNDYSELVITAANEATAFEILDGQIWDGAFENSRVGAIFCVERDEYVTCGK